MQNILITGNMGYIGPTLVRTLKAGYPGVKIVGVDTGFFGHCLTGAEVLPETRIDVQYIRDVRDIELQFLRGVDSVVHLAAISNDPMGNAFENVTAEVNYRSSLRIAEMAKEAGVKSYVFASSCSVYGYAEGEARDENSELNPLTAYARSKINTEKSIQGLAEDSFVVTSLRFPTACGMSERLRLDLVLNDFVAAAVASRKIKILSDGTPWRPLIDIKDMSRAMNWAVSREASNGGAFLAVNVGRTEWNYQVRDLAEAVKEQMPDVELEINTEAQPDKRSYRVDFSLYKSLAPGHLPQVPLDQSIRELREGLERMGFDNQDFRNSQYMRLKVLNGLQERKLLGKELRWIA
ncbi:MAG: SDR family oxidoreductase [Gammaproteobacteria bacterium]|jgi:nucleoside-diphosphate-sugar epimerase|nr:SDR family oxidoreductase [Gammaproteobacteria bacterium]